MKIIAPDASSVLGLTYLSPSGMYVVTLVETAIKSSYGYHLFIDESTGQREVATRIS